jgi:PAS domain S-box-containing protein
MDVIKILSIDRNKGDQRALIDFFADHHPQFEITPASTISKAVKVLRVVSLDLVLYDPAGERSGELDLLEVLQDIPWVVITEEESPDDIIKAFKSGAVDYLLKDREGDYLRKLSQGLEAILQGGKPLTASSGCKEQLAEMAASQAQTQDALKESREIYRRFFQTARDAVFISSSDGRWIDMNAKALELFGYNDRAEIWSDSVLEFYCHPEERKNINQKITTDGILQDYQVEFKRKGGGSFTALVSAVPYEIGGRFVGYQGFITDITDEIASRAERDQLIQAQAALDCIAIEMGTSRELKEVYQNLSHHLQSLFRADAVSIYRLDTSGEGFRDEFSWSPGPSQARILDQFRLGKLSGAVLDHLIETKAPLIIPMPADAGRGEQGEMLTSLFTEVVEEPTAGPLPSVMGMLLAPIVIDDMVIAVIQVISLQEEPYSDGDAALLSRITSVVAIGLQKAYMFQESQALLKKFTSLQHIEATVLENLSLTTIMDMLVEDLARELNADAADILYLHPSINTLELIAHAGFRQKVLQYISLETTEGLPGQVVADRKLVYIHDLHELSEGVARPLEFAAEDFTVYFGVPLLTKGRLVGVLEIYQRKPCHPDRDWLDLLDMVAGLVAIAIDIHNLYADSERSRNDTLMALDAIIERWAEGLELRGVESPGHWRRIERLTLMLAQRMGVPEKEIKDIRRGVLLHDVGKMAIPDQILQKGGKLSAQEWKLIGHHPVEAYELLRPVSALRAALDIPLYHHERWDGEGYPYGVKGEEIPFSARLFAIVDVWDAMQSERPYRGAFSREEAIQHIKKQAGKHFDPDIAREFLRMIEEIYLDSETLQTGKQQPELKNSVVGE